MAVTATFAADFSSFQDAVTKAQTKLVQFQGSTAGVEKSLSRMTESFSGKRLIEDATKMVEAVDRVGGISKLTDTELKKVSSTVGEAAAKMRAMGIDVPPGFTKIAQSTSLADRSMGLLSGTVGKMAAAFSIAGLIDKTVGTITSLATEALHGAGALVDMSAKTGLSTETLQRFGFVGKQAGVSVDAFADAAFKLGVKLSTGSGSTREAVEKLGLAYQELKGLSPDQQFAKIVAALEKMDDPQTRNRLGVELFGKSFSTIAPAVERGYTAMAAQAVVSSDKQIRALDDASDAWDRFWSKQTSRFTAWLGDNVIATQQIGKLTEEQRKHYSDLIVFGGNAQQYLLELSAKAAKQIDISLPKQEQQTKATAGYSEELKKAQTILDGMTAAERRGLEAGLKLGKSTDDLANSFGVSDGVIKLATDAMHKNEAATTKAAEQQKKFADALKEITSVQETFGQTVLEVDGHVAAGIRYYLQRGQSIEHLATVYDLTKEQVQAFSEQLKFEESVATATTKSFSGLNNIVTAMMPRFGELHEMIRGINERTGLLNATVLESEDKMGAFGFVAKSTSGFITHFANQEEYAAQQSAGLRDQLHQLRQGTASFSESLKKIVSGDVLSGFKQLGTTLKAALNPADILNTAIGGALSGGITALTNLATKGLGALLGKLFGNPEKQINPIREAFVQAAGGLAALNQRAHEAGITLDHLLNAKNPEAYKKAIDELTAAFDFQDQSMATLDETVKRYGFTIEELGPALQRQELDKQAQQIFKDWQVLNSAGIDTTVIAGKMADSINEYVKRAVGMGIEVPASMRPMLQRMIDMGLLTDASGTKIEDFETSGISFAETMTEGFTRVVDSVTKLADAISKTLGGAINSIPTERTIHIGYQYDPINLPDNGMATGGLVTAHGIQHFAGGGNVLPFVPRGTDRVPAMLTPGEMVLTKGQQQRLLSGGGRMNTAAIEDKLDRNHRQALEEARRQPERTAIAVRDAIVLAGLGRRRS